MGIVEKRTDSVAFEGKQTIGPPSDVIARQGLAYVRRSAASSRA